MVRNRRPFLMRPRDLISPLPGGDTLVQDLAALMASHPFSVHWRGDDFGPQGADNIADSSGNAHTGTSKFLEPDEFRVAGPSAAIPFALAADAPTEACSQVPADPDFDFGTAATAMTWVKSVGVGARNVMGQYDGDFSWLARVGSGDTEEVLVFVLEDAGFLKFKQYQTTVPVLDGNWHHFALTWEGTGTGILRMYVDGVEDTPTKTVDDAFTTANDSINLLGWSNQNNINGSFGSFAEFALGQFVLTPAEILAIFNAGKP